MERENNMPEYHIATGKNAIEKSSTSDGRVKVTVLQKNENSPGCSEICSFIIEDEEAAYDFGHAFLGTEEFFRQDH